AGAGFPPSHEATAEPRSLGEGGSSAPLRDAADRLRAATMRAIDPLAAGVTVAFVGRTAATASTGATDFGAYFSYFSVFLVVSALCLAALFFRLSVEQRLPEIGVLRAAGFSISAIRRV